MQWTLKDRNVQDSMKNAAMIVLTGQITQHLIRIDAQ